MLIYMWYAMRLLLNNNSIYIGVLSMSIHKYNLVVINSKHYTHMKYDIVA